MFPVDQRFGKGAVTSRYLGLDRPEVRTPEAKLPVVFSVLAPQIPACFPATQIVWRDKHPADFDQAEAIPAPPSSKCLPYTAQSDIHVHQQKCGHCRKVP